MRVGRLLGLVLLHLACGHDERPPRGFDELRQEVERRLDEAASDGFSGSALVKLQGEGALVVRDSLATIFDDVPPDKAAITLLQVIHHTAGFRDDSNMNPSPSPIAATIIATTTALAPTRCSRGCATSRMADSSGVCRIVAA